MTPDQYEAKLRGYLAALKEGKQEPADCPGVRAPGTTKYPESGALIFDNESPEIIELERQILWEIRAACGDTYLGCAKPIETLPIFSPDKPAA